MHPSFESLDRVLARTRAAIVADIGSVRETEGPRFYRLLEFAAIPVETLFGKRFATRPVACRYLQGVVHRRGDLDVAPLISGSGIEFDIKTGDRVIGAYKPGSCNVLRIESLGRRDAVKPPDAASTRD